MKLIHIHGVWPLYTNTFLLITAAGHAVVVDPAAEAETYLAQLKENNATLTDIFLTHGHYDHVGSVAALKKATGAKVHMDLADAKGDQMYPLTPDLIDAAWPAGNSEYQVDELTFRIWHTPGHTPAAWSSPAATGCSAAIPCLRAAAAVWTCLAAARRRCNAALLWWRICPCRMKPPSTPAMKALPPLARNAGPTHI